ITCAREFAGEERWRDCGVREARRNENGRGGGIPRDRRPHFARSRILPWLSEASGAARHVCDQQSLLVDRGRQILQLRGGIEAGPCHSENGAFATKRLSRGRGHQCGVSTKLKLSCGLGCAARLRGPPGNSETVFRRRLEARLQGSRQKRAARSL